MSSGLEALLQFARRMLSLLLIPPALLLSLALVAVSYAIGNGSLPLLAAGVIYLAFSLGSILYGLKGKRDWLAWITLLAAAIPPGSVFFATMGK